MLSTKRKVYPLFTLDSAELSVFILTGMSQGRERKEAIVKLFTLCILLLQ